MSGRSRETKDLQTLLANRTKNRAAADGSGEWSCTALGYNIAGPPKRTGLADVRTMIISALGGTSAFYRILTRSGAERKFLSAVTKATPCTRAVATINLSAGSELMEGGSCAESSAIQGVMART